MFIKAICSFSGALTMCQGETREYNNQAVLDDLLRAGYVEEVIETSSKTKKSTKKAVTEDGTK